MTPQQQAVTDLCSALGIKLPDYTTRVVIEAESNGSVVVTISEAVVDAEPSRISRSYAVVATESSPSLPPRSTFPHVRP